MRGLYPRKQTPHPARCRFASIARCKASASFSKDGGRRPPMPPSPTRGEGKPDTTHFPFSPAIFAIRFASTAQYVAGRNRCSRSMNHASLPIRMRGWFFSMPVMMRCAATGGVVLAIASKRSIDSARRALSVIAGAGAGIAHDVRQHAAGMHHRQFDRAVRHRELMPQAFGKSAHREFRRAIGGLAGRGDDAEDRGEVDDMRLAPLRKMRQEGARAVHHAPEIDVDQPLHLRLVDLVEGAEQGDAGIVDDDVQAGMRGDRRSCKILDLRRARRRRRDAR